MISLFDLLLTRAPAMVIVQTDRRYAKRCVREVLGLMKQGSEVPYLEWNRMMGWKASIGRSAELLARTGLSDLSPFSMTTPSETDPAAWTLQNFAGWAGSIANATEGDGVIKHAFSRGMVVMHDIVGENEGRHPDFLRVVGETIEAMVPLNASLIFVTSERLPASHPILTLCPQIQPRDEPERRIGSVLSMTLGQLQQQAAPNLWEYCLERLKTFSLGDVDVILRLLIIRVSRLQVASDGSRSLLSPQDVLRELDATVKDIKSSDTTA